MRKHLKAHESAGDLKLEKADSLSSSGEHSPINNSSHSSTMSDEGQMSRERLPSFEIRLSDQQNQNHSHSSAENEYTSQMHGAYHYDMQNSEVQPLGFNYQGGAGLIPGSYLPAYHPHAVGEHLDGVAEGQAVSTGTDLNLWNPYNTWGTPLTSQLVAPHSY